MLLALLGALADVIGQVHVAVPQFPTIDGLLITRKEGLMGTNRTLILVIETEAGIRPERVLPVSFTLQSGPSCLGAYSEHFKNSQR